MMSEIFGDFGLHCAGCCRSDSHLSIYGNRSFSEVMKEAYAKGWVTVCQSGYDGGDGRHRAYCPNCAPRYKSYRFWYCV